MTLKTVNIKAIRIDGGTQSRIEISNDTVAEYADAIKAKAVFPAMVAFHDGADYWLADGFHRWHALGKAGKTSAEVDVRTGTLRDAVLFSLGANGTHGMRRTNADKRKAVESMLADAEWSTWSDHKIADACGVSHPFVAAVRSPKVAEKQVENRRASSRKTADPLESDSKKSGPGVESDSKKQGQSLESDSSVAAGKPALAAVELPPQEDEYTELDEARDQIKALQDMLAVASMGDVSDEDKAQAKELIAELRSEIKTLRATLKAVTQSRDTLMNELAQVKRQCMGQQRELKTLKAAHA